MFGGGFFLVIALLSFGMAARSRKPFSFRLINATVMTRAERPKAESWVHLAQTSTNGGALIIGLGVAGIGCLGIFVYAGLQAFGVIAQVNIGVSKTGPIIGMVFMAAIGIFLCWITLLMVQRNVRSGGIGARPSGVALGETAVALRVPGRDVEIPWTQIESVDIVATVPAANDRAVPPMIRITLREGPVAGRAQMLAGEGYRVPRACCIPRYGGISRTRGRDGNWGVLRESGASKAGGCKDFLHNLRDTCRAGDNHSNAKNASHPNMSLTQ